MSDNPTPMEELMHTFEAKRENFATDYHFQKEKSSVFGIKQNVIEERNGKTWLVPGEDTKKLGKLFQAPEYDPAGGWYLVKEQREWLKKNLYDILSLYKEYDTVRVMEAGVASYIHHYTYLAILNEVLQMLPITIRIHLIVVDKYAYPLQQIAVIEKLLQDNQLTSTHPKGLHYPIREDFIAFMEANPRQFGSISTELYQKDFTKSRTFSEIGKCNIITEHYLLTFALGLDGIKVFRKTHSQRLKKGGYLLSAAGSAVGLQGRTKQNNDRYANYINICKDVGLEFVSDQLTWDPYDIQRNELAGFTSSKPEAIPAPFENTLALFRKA